MQLKFIRVKKFKSNIIIVPYESNRLTYRSEYYFKYINKDYKNIRPANFRYNNLDQENNRFASRFVKGSNHIYLFRSLFQSDFNRRGARQMRRWSEYLRYPASQPTIIK